MKKMKKLGVHAPKLPSRGMAVSTKKFATTTMNQQQASAMKTPKGVKNTC